MTSRRGFLRLAGSLAVGVGLFVISDGLFSSELLRNSEDLTTSLVGPINSADSKASLITVKAYYTMMAQYTNLTEEDYVLQSPATIQDLLNTCIVRHPTMAQMMATMLILLNGAPSQPTAGLNDGDTVQFIPLTAGG